MEEKILTLHPEGKQGVNISKQKYEMMRGIIIQILKEKGELTFTGLGKEVAKKLKGKYEGSIGWYYTTVKLDLEARKVIARIPKSKPQMIRLNEK